jgi:hypothetical protein
VATPKPKASPASTATALAGKSANPLGPRFVELTSRIIPVKSGLGKRLFAAAHALGALPGTLGRRQLRALVTQFRQVLKATGLAGRFGDWKDVDLLFEIRKHMTEGAALEAKDPARFLEQYGGREGYVIGRVLEKFVVNLDALQGFLREGAKSHRSLLNDAIRMGVVIDAKGRAPVVDGLGRPFTQKAVFEAPVPMKDITRILLNEDGSLQEVQFFDYGFGSPSKTGGYWSVGSGQEIKGPGVARDISKQVSLRDPRVKGSFIIVFKAEVSKGNWEETWLTPDKLVSMPGSLVSVGITVQGTRSSLMSMPASKLQSILNTHSNYRIVGRGDRQRSQVTLGIPISNFRALIRAAMGP